MVVRRVNPRSVARVAGLIGASVGLLISCLLMLSGVLVKAFSVVQRLFEQTPESAPSASTAPPWLGLFYLLGLPVLYGLSSFVCAWLGARLYNVFAARFGGIEIDIA